MKVKIKKDQILPNNWKPLGYTQADWEKLNKGETIEMDSIPNEIEKYVDAVESVSKKIIKDGGCK